MHFLLHGFLGQKEDWEPLLHYLKTPATAINLPGHAGAPLADDIALEVKRQVPFAKTLIGYSAGGRLALELKGRFPKDYERVIVLSSHFGLQKEEEKNRRWQQDLQWIEILRSAPFDTFLTQWYEQKLFQSLKLSPHFEEMLLRRKTQNPRALAHFLERYSLAKQKILQIYPNTIFIYGDADLKYGKLYRKLDNAFVVKHAGHAVHLENPQGCATLIQRILDDN